MPWFLRQAYNFYTYPPDNLFIKCFVAKLFLKITFSISSKIKKRTKYTTELHMF
jgi:hypothetical protein